MACAVTHVSLGEGDMVELEPQSPLPPLKPSLGQHQVDMKMKAGRPNFTSGSGPERGSPCTVLSRSHQEQTKETILKQKLMQTAQLQHEIDVFRKTSSEAVVAGVKVCHGGVDQIHSSPLQSYDMTQPTSVCPTVVSEAACFLRWARLPFSAVAPA